MVGYKAPATATEVKKAFLGWNPMYVLRTYLTWIGSDESYHRSVDKLLSFLPEDVERWRLIDLPPINDWIHPSNKLMFLGDSIHATLPYLAQGAAMAIEDASAIGTCLSHLENIEQLPELLKLYHRTRMNRVHTIQRGSWTNRFFIHMRKGPMLDMRTQVFAAGDYNGSPNLMANTLFTNWLYSYDVVTETEKEWAKSNRSHL